MRISDWISDVCSSDRAAGLPVDALGPGNAGHIGFGRKQLSGAAVEHVEEAVLRRVQQHLAVPPAELHVREDDRLGRGIVPFVARRFLIVPDISAGIRSEEHTSELQSLMRISYAVFCLKKKKIIIIIHNNTNISHHTT